MTRTSSSSSAMAALGASLLLVALLDCPLRAEAAVHRMKLHKRSDEEFVDAKLRRAREHVVHPDHEQDGAAAELM